MKSLFLDTNIYLMFYHLSSDDLEELRKLIVLIESDRAKLYVPIQVIQEFKRNRDNKIADALKRLREEKIGHSFPQYFKEYDEFKQLVDLITKYEDVKKILLKKTDEDVKNLSLKADEVIQGLFAKAQIINYDWNTYNTAKFRFELGNPPGKNNSIGDAINWESLKSGVPNGEDLIFVTDDKDYFSIIDPQEFNRFLKDEWEQEKFSKIIHYRRLSDFFKKEFPSIKLASELEKDLLIKKLIQSGSFWETRDTLRKLHKYSKQFSADQIQDIITGAITNTQIYWIATDQDIQGYLFDILSGFENKIDSSILEKFYSLYENDQGLTLEDDELNMNTT